jgi:DNA polymerase III subunit gamma/tau
MNTHFHDDLRTQAMSYLVLARKWRPRSFKELVGQEHVQRALIHSLENDRVHHALLFTGTRGVGKTTIARILAKSLNCETGVTATPCGVCSACREIDEGRFVDLIEVDAASRTKVDDTRELLDNVQYSPAKGRYKVYLIDEVHMLSTHSFNALLKTLEEPPPHVKFLLATTDPQKLPVTVLSRCLQFNLKRFSAASIAARLTEITTAEGMQAEPEALRLVARAADGSMRDALSLLDQVIAFGRGKLTVADTSTMLGTVDRSQIHVIVNALAQHDARAILGAVATLDERAPDYKEVLAEIAALLQRTALLQAVSDLDLDDVDDVAAIRALSTALSPEEVQLFYQIALVGRRDLELAPDGRAGFEMVLLRMLAFTSTEARSVSSSVSSPPVAIPAVKSGASAAASAPAMPRTAASETGWTQIVAQLGLQGPVTQLAAHCVLVSRQPGRVQLALDADGEPFRRPILEEKLAQSLSGYFGEPMKIEFMSAPKGVVTPAREQRAAADDRQRAAEVSIESDPNVRAMRDIFGATVQPDSVRPTE